MSYKLLVARWIANRIATRNRTERRTLRDHLRAQLGQLRHDEKRVRGLRLYVAWSQPRRAEAEASFPLAGWSHASHAAI